MLVVRIDLHVFTNRENTSGIDRSLAPFPVAALVEGLNTHIRRHLIRTNWNRLFHLESISIPPGKVATLPVKVKSTPVSHQNLRRNRKAGSHNWLKPVCRRSAVGLRQVAVSRRHHQRTRLRIIQIELPDLGESDPRMNVEINARSNLGLNRLAALSRLFRLQLDPHHGTQLVIQVYL